MNERNDIEQEIIYRVESDLKKYPDWIVRIEVGGLGIPNRALKLTANPGINISSIVEKDVELSDEIKRKVIIIETVYDRLRGKIKDIVNDRYFMDYSRNEILIKHGITKKRYYLLRDRALESFARALGYIE